MGFRFKRQPTGAYCGDWPLGGATAQGACRSAAAAVAVGAPLRVVSFLAPRRLSSCVLHFFFFGQRLRFWFRFRWLRLVAAKAHRTNAVARIFFSSNCARGGSVMDVWSDFLNAYSAPLFELIARELLNFSRKFPPALLEHRCTDRIPSRTT